MHAAAVQPQTCTHARTHTQTDGQTGATCRQDVDCSYRTKLTMTTQRHATSSDHARGDAAVAS